MLCTFTIGRSSTRNSLLFSNFTQRILNHKYFMYHNQNSGSSVILWYIFYAITKRIKILFFTVVLFNLFNFCFQPWFSMQSCSHMAALLFKSEACTQLQLNKVAVTSKLCPWNRSKKSAEADILKNINLK